MILNKPRRAARLQGEACRRTRSCDSQACSDCGCRRRQYCACGAIRSKYQAVTCRLPFRRSSSKLCAILDLSRGLRVDERNLRKTAPGVIGPVDPEQGVQRRSTLVFFGDPAQVSEGFALALHAM